jgi:hypothetical protein
LDFEPASHVSVVVFPDEVWQGLYHLNAPKSVQQASQHTLLSAPIIKYPRKDLRNKDMD